MTPTWTKERPTVPGAYWRENAEGDRYVTMVRHRATSPDSMFPGGRWAGPIPEPAEPPEVEAGIMLDYAAESAFTRIILDVDWGDERTKGGGT